MGITYSGSLRKIMIITTYSTRSCVARVRLYRYTSVVLFDQLISVITSYIFKLEIALILYSAYKTRQINRKVHVRKSLCKI